jgi:hypothetical protein
MSTSMLASLGLRLHSFLPTTSASFRFQQETDTRKHIVGLLLLLLLLLF